MTSTRDCSPSEAELIVSSRRRKSSEGHETFALTVVPSSGDNYWTISSWSATNHFCSELEYVYHPRPSPLHVHCTFPTDSGESSKFALYTMGPVFQAFRAMKILLHLELVRLSKRRTMSHTQNMHHQRSVHIKKEKKSLPHISFSRYFLKLEAFT
jgi:hypothetical protein